MVRAMKAKQTCLRELQIRNPVLTCLETIHSKNNFTIKKMLKIITPEYFNANYQILQHKLLTLSISERKLHKRYVAWFT